MILREFVSSLVLAAPKAAELFFTVRSTVDAWDVAFFDRIEARFSGHLVFQMTETVGREGGGSFEDLADGAFDSGWISTDR